MNNKYKNILIPIDLDCESSWRYALPAAVDMARNHQAVLHVLSVVPDIEIPAIAALLPEGMDSRIMEEGASELSSLINGQVPEEIATEILVSQGRPYKEILKAVDSTSADIVVMASHRPLLSDYLLGTNAAYVTRHAECSVMVIREPKASQSE